MPTSNTDTNIAEITRTLIEGTVENLQDKRGALLPILHAIQGNLGYVPEETLPMLADALNLTRAEVHGVVTFYHDFRTEKTGRSVIQICQAESCQALEMAGSMSRASTLLRR